MDTAFTFPEHKACRVQPYYVDDTARCARIIDFVRSTEPHVAQYMSRREMQRIVDEMIAREGLE